MTICTRAHLMPWVIAYSVTSLEWDWDQDGDHITLSIFGENLNPCKNSNPWRKLFLQVAPINAHSLSEQTLNHTSHNIEKTLIRNPCEQLAIHSRVLQYIFIYKIYLIFLQTKQIKICKYFTFNGNKQMKIYKIYLLLLQTKWKRVNILCFHGYFSY